MRILQIIPSLQKGGAERLVLDICNSLIGLEGISVKLITFRNENAYAFLTTNIDWEVIPSSVELSITGKSRANVSQLIRSIEEFQPDIIHSHLFETEIVLSQVNYLKATHVVHFHDNMIQFENFAIKTLIKKTLMANFFEKSLLIKAYKQRPTRVITISENGAQYVQKVLPRHLDKHLLHNAINLNRFTPGKINPPKNNLVMIGSLVEKKGQELAIECVAELRNRGVLVKLDLIGEGPNRAKLERLIHSLNLKDQINLRGNVDYPENYLQNASIYIHTAKYEPFGLVLIEAMACGLPIVCTDGGGNRDLMQNGINGFLVIQRDAALLADKIELLLKDKVLYDTLSKNAFEFAKDFGLEKYTQNLLAIYTSSDKSI